MKQIAAANPDAVMVDITFRDRDGIDLCRQIQERWSKLPVLVTPCTVSRCTPSEERRDDRQAGGYGFGDDHIHKILSRAIKDDVDRRLLIVSRSKDAPEANRKISEIVERLDDKNEQIIVGSGSAKEFLDSSGLANPLLETLLKPKDDPF